MISCTFIPRSRACHEFKPAARTAVGGYGQRSGLDEAIPSAAGLRVGSNARADDVSFEGERLTLIY